MKSIPSNDGNSSCASSKQSSMTTLLRPRGGNCGSGEMGILLVPVPGEVSDEGDTRCRSSLVDMRFRARLRKWEKNPFWEDERERPAAEGSESCRLLGLELAAVAAEGEGRG